ncbi:hypothetical protein C0Q70_12516 [Pomacea canaliculata]|uniref:Immunoglobulin-like beta-sandwich domain-containing protein n=1 Tax=Pomacea canaliculata TaxID=400727 RepID=A0A2T7P1T3_POMCA|nr:hypothetical protein C0Q70_12516 [Pomacea canaliculata]
MPNFRIVCRGLNGHNVACFQDGFNSFKLNLSVRRQYTDIVWEKFVQNTASVVLKHTKMQVLYAPGIESLQVDTKNVTEKDHLVDKGQKVTITCSFDPGNPPDIFHLLRNGDQILSSSQTGQRRLDYSLVVDDCSEVWPMIRCQAEGSNLSRSVAILVRCSPRFLEAPDYANILDPQVTFSLRSHTTNISNCRVAKFTPRAGREKRVNCSISGSPPELLLTLPLHNQPWVEEGKWKLVIENELGTSETIITLSSSE